MNGILDENVLETKTNENQINEEIIKKYRLREILASANISFLFGSGVNGRAFPQLIGFKETNDFLDEKYIGDSNSFEEKLNSLNEIDRNKANELFVKEFNIAEKKIDMKHSDIMDVENLIENTYRLVETTENRQDSSYKVNIFTLNYDDIVETILQNKSYVNNVLSADSYKKTNFFDVIGYNFKYNKKIPTFITAKLHGSVNRGILAQDAIIYPGNKKYETALGSKFFELMFLMKEELIKQNAVLIVIGYSGNDEHLNGLISDAIESSLTVIWFKYDNAKDVIPETIRKHGDKVIVIDQLEDKIGTAKRCSNIIEGVLKECL